MKVAITQPNFIPWLGFFDLLDTVDLWLVLDNVQLSKRSYIVRNRIADIQQNQMWLSHEIKKSFQRANINKVQINNSKPWLDKITGRIKSSYRHSAFFKQYSMNIFSILGNRSNQLSTFNTESIVEICQIIGIDIKYIYASEIVSNIEGSAQSKILALAKEVNTTEYYNFKNGVTSGLYDPDTFCNEGIKLYMQDYNHSPYKQFNSSTEFVSHLSVLDLLFHQGPTALEIIRSGSQWKFISSFID
ncbi:MAG: WbqC family protein [Gammaproteobacteria bacterium]|nr:WbqC family protein [Gammaproteobacteria bacterium]